MSHLCNPPQECTCGYINMLNAYVECWNRFSLPYYQRLTFYGKRYIWARVKTKKLV